MLAAIACLAIEVNAVSFHKFQLVYDGADVKTFQGLLFKVGLHEILEKFRAQIDRLELCMGLFRSLCQVPESQGEDIEVLGLVVIEDNFLGNFGEEL